MDIEKLPEIIGNLKEALCNHNQRLQALERGVKLSKTDLSAMIEPTIVDGNIFIPLLGRTIAVDSIENEEKYNWKQAMDYCKEHGLELPSKDDALILLWQFDKINALLRSLGKPEISKESWLWTKTEYSATTVWSWHSGYWLNSLHKSASFSVVPFFAID